MAPDRRASPGVGRARAGSGHEESHRGLLSDRKAFGAACSPTGVRPASERAAPIPRARPADGPHGATGPVKMSPLQRPGGGSWQTRILGAHPPRGPLGVRVRGAGPGTHGARAAVAHGTSDASADGRESQQSSRMGGGPSRRPGRAADEPVEAVRSPRWPCPWLEPSDTCRRAEGAPAPNIGDSEGAAQWTFWDA